MNRQFIPYYISRAVLSLGFSLLVLGFTWKAALLAAFFFALFLVYLHSGWFPVDPSQPLFPLRRDDRGREIQRKALIAALLAGVALFLLLMAGPIAGGAPSAAPLAIALAVIVYFVSQFVLLARA
jgi:archaellum biogenesis protein FlaJ (TadC family)